MNSDAVPHYSNPVSELKEITCSSSNSVFSLIKQAHDDAVVRTDYNRAPFQLPKLIW